MTVLWMLLGVLAAIVLLLCLPLTLRLSWLPKPEQPAPCLLTDEEKEKMCDIVCEAGADYIKTSTGFSTAGATFHDVELMVKGVHGRCKVKAAGGISTVEDMETFLALGADRLGTSRAVKILNGEQAKGY